MGGGKRDSERQSNIRSMRTKKMNVEGWGCFLFGYCLIIDKIMAKESPHLFETKKKLTPGKLTTVKRVFTMVLIHVLSDTETVLNEEWKNHLPSLILHHHLPSQHPLHFDHLDHSRSLANYSSPSAFF